MFNPDKPPNLDGPEQNRVDLQELRNSARDFAKAHPLWVVLGGGVLLLLILGGGDLSEFGGVIWIFIGAILYFLPAIIARNKHNSGSVFVINLFLGWTVIGWIVALAMAANNPPAPTRPVQQVPSASVPTQASTGRTCPFCAEEIKSAAIVCKHCGRDLPTPE